MWETPFARNAGALDCAHSIVREYTFYTFEERANLSVACPGHDVGRPRDKANKIALSTSRW